jgi:hypothetical protein
MAQPVWMEESNAVKMSGGLIDGGSQVSGVPPRAPLSPPHPPAGRPGNPIPDPSAVPEDPPAWELEGPQPPLPHNTPQK